MNGIYPTELGHLYIGDPDTLPKCRLKKMETADGFFTFKEGKAWIGKEYHYIPQHHRPHFIHAPTGQEHDTECVLAYDPGRTCFGCMPVECLEFPDDPRTLEIAQILMILANRGQEGQHGE